MFVKLSEGPEVQIAKASGSAKLRPHFFHIGRFLLILLPGSGSNNHSKKECKYYPISSDEKYCEPAVHKDSIMSD